MLNMNKEAMTIVVVILGGFAFAVAIAMSVSLVGEKLFPDHLWPRFLIAAPIVLALGYSLFADVAKGKSAGADSNCC
jgi:hypothetical protein